MALLNDEIRKEVKKMLTEMTSPVKLVTFTKESGCEYCDQLVELLNEVAELSDKLSVQTYELGSHAEIAQRYGVTEAPTIVFEGAKDYGIRFHGIPAGYEFSTLLHGILAVSRGHSELDEQSKAYLDGLAQPVDLQVFVTTSCPYCPRAATLAMEMALASDKVKARVYEATEYQELFMDYDVMGVPLTVVNDRERIEGAAPVPMVMDAIRHALEG